MSGADVRDSDSTPATRGKACAPLCTFCLQVSSSSASQCVWQGDARFTARSAAAIQLWGQPHRQRLTQVRRSVLGRRQGHCVQHSECAGTQDEVEKAACLPALLSLLEEGSQEEKLGAVGCLAQLMPAAGGPGAIMVLEQVGLSPCHRPDPSAHTVLDKLPKAQPENLVVKQVPVRVCVSVCC